MHEPSWRNSPGWQEVQLSSAKQTKQLLGHLTQALMDSDLKYPIVQSVTQDWLKSSEKYWVVAVDVQSWIKHKITFNTTLVQEIHVIKVRLLGANINTSSAQFVTEKSRVAALNTLSCLSFGEWDWVDWAVVHASPSGVLAKCTLAAVWDTTDCPVVGKWALCALSGTKSCRTVGPSELLLVVESHVPETLVQTQSCIIVSKSSWGTILNTSVCRVETIQRRKEWALLYTCLGAVVLISDNKNVCNWFSVIGTVDNARSWHIVGESISTDVAFELAKTGCRIGIKRCWAILGAYSCRVEAVPAHSTSRYTTSWWILGIQTWNWGANFYTSLGWPIFELHSSGITTRDT